MALYVQLDPLDPAGRTDVAVKQILRQQLQVMADKEPDIGPDTDPELLHDYRVSLRRTRSALAQFREIFPRNIVSRYRREFAWLGELTGSVRDLDVLLLQFNNELMEPTFDQAGSLSAVKGLLEQKRLRAHEELKKGFQSTRYHRLIGGWESFLAAPVPERSKLPDAKRPIIQVGTECIKGIYKQVRRQGRRLNKHTKVARLHEFRKICKKQRYLITLFEDLYPSKVTTPLIKATTRLQDAFGVIQDLEVQQRMLKEFHSYLAAENGLPPDSLGAVKEWKKILKQRKQKMRTKCAKRFAAFDRPKNRARFRELFSQSDAGSRLN